MIQDRHTPTISNVTVERTGKNRVRISWETGMKDLEVSIYVGESPDRIERTSPAFKAKGKTWADIKGLDRNARHYFLVAPQGGNSLITAERRISLEGSVNFRDIGGYETGDGARLKWGQVFRSDSLARLTAEDQSILKQMGIKVVCDFRTTAEIEKAPDQLPEEGAIEQLHLPITHGEFNFVTALERIKQGDDSWITDDFMVRGYIMNIEEFSHTWGAVLKRITEKKSRPFVFHCTGGKDRAGTCAALILLALGIPEETVIYDHQLSNVFIADLWKVIYKRLESYGVDPKKLEPYFTAPLECIVALIDHISSTYGSVTHYLKERAGIGEETLALLKKELLV
ncbi:MAG: tyrosine-protein phosphatase [Deltaproteobacteria bacterium]|nr:tyrosine-protein phosphatase [Deltaproteobacteria bacterium]